jgi:hypothetical protein
MRLHEPSELPSGPTPRPSLDCGHRPSRIDADHHNGFRHHHRLRNRSHAAPPIKSIGRTVAMPAPR